MGIFGLGMAQKHKKKKLEVVLVRNFLVATYRNSTGIRQKGKKGIYGLSESKSSQTEGRKRGCWASGVKGARGAKALGPSILEQVLFGRHFLLWVLVSVITDHPSVLGRVMTLKCL